MQIPDVVSVTHAGGHRLRVRFDDGVEGEIDLRSVVQFRGVFAPLADAAYVEKVFVASDIGTLAWPNGADLDPLTLYAHITGRAVAALLSPPGQVAG